MISDGQKLILHPLTRRRDSIGQRITVTVISTQHQTNEVNGGLPNESVLTIFAWQEMTAAMVAVTVVAREQDYSAKVALTH